MTVTSFFVAVNVTILKSVVMLQVAVAPSSPTVRVASVFLAAGFLKLVFIFNN